MAIFRAPASDTAISHIVGYTISLISVHSIFLRGQIGTLQLHIVLSIYVSPLHPHLGYASSTPKALPILILWIQTSPEKVRQTPQIIPQSHFLRRYGWIHRDQELTINNQQKP